MGPASVLHFLSLLWMTNFHVSVSSHEADKPNFSCQMKEFPGEPRNIEDWNRLWENARVPYEFADSLSEGDRTVFRRAMSQFHEKTCVRWVPRQQETGYVVVKVDHAQKFCGAAHSCNHHKRQEITLNRHCHDDLLTMVHEMLHTLCFVHEQQRSDRSDFLSFDGCPDPHQITPIYPVQVNEGGLYDYTSQVHYQCGLDSCYGYPSMKGVGPGYCGRDANTNGLSVLDIDKINHVYNCQGRCQTHRWINLANLTRGDSRWDDLVNFAPPNEPPLHVCRGYGGPGEILAGFFWLSELVCILPYNGFYVTIRSHIEVFTLPQGSQPISFGSSPYFLSKPEFDNPDRSPFYVPVGREINNKPICIATKVESNGKTYVGSTWPGRKYALLVDTEKKDTIYTRDFMVLTCR